MINSPYKGILECARLTYRTEGLRAFYRSYTTQLTMNVPYQSIHFVMYEFCQNLTNPDRRYNPTMHMTSGAIAGKIGFLSFRTNLTNFFKKNLGAMPDK